MTTDSVHAFTAEGDSQVRIIVRFVPGGDITPIEETVLKTCAEALEKLWDMKVQRSNHQLGVRGR